MNKYVDEFFQLECSGDVLDAVGNVNNLHKEITEAMAVIKRMKDFSFRYGRDIDLIDICSGNALVPVISSFLYRFCLNYAIDKRIRIVEGVDNFHYSQFDIYEEMFEKFLKVEPNRGVILTSVHACRDLAKRTVELYNSIDNIKHLILMPCCTGKLDKNYPNIIRSKLGKDLVWVYDLYDKCVGKKNIVRDNYVLSPRNYIITASKE